MCAQEILYLPNLSVSGTVIGTRGMQLRQQWDSGFGDTLRSGFGRAFDGRS